MFTTEFTQYQYYVRINYDETRTHSYRAKFIIIRTYCVFAQMEFPRFMNCLMKCRRLWVFFTIVNYLKYDYTEFYIRNSYIFVYLFAMHFLRNKNHLVNNLHVTIKHWDNIIVKLCKLCGYIPIHLKVDISTYSLNINNWTN